MIVNQRRFFYIFTLLMLLFFLQVGPVYGMGAREDPLDEARQLIEERKYNDAIAIISEVMKENPRRFDDAEKLMSDIRVARAEYNRVYNHLIEILDIQEGEELNEEEAYAIIQKLEQLDADPNEASVAAFAQARRSIVFTVNNQRFQGIMTEGDQLLDEGRYMDAVELYLSGFNLHRDRFGEEDYGAGAETRAEALAENIRELIADYDETLAELRDLMTDFTAEGTAADTSWEALKPMYTQLQLLWEELVQRGTEIEQLRDSLMDTNDADIPYLSTLSILTRGRADSEKPNGIAGAVERPLVLALQDVSEDMLTMVEQLYLEAEEEYNGNEYASADEKFEAAINLIFDIRPFYSRWTSLHNQRIAFDMPHKIGPSQRDTQSDSLYLQAMETAAKEYNASIEISQRLDELETAGDDPAAIQENRDELLALIDTMAANQQVIDEQLEDIMVYAEQGVATDQAGAVLTRMRANFSSQFERAQLIEGAYLVSIAEQRYEENVSTIETAEAKVEDAVSFVVGVEETLPGADAPITVKYPQRSVQLIREALEDLQPAREVIDATVSLLTDTKEYIRRQEQVRLSRDRGLRLLQRIQDLTGKARTALSTAEDLNRNADLAFSEGEIRLQQAQDELRNDRFEAAREKLEQAGYSFSESLTFREDPEVRRLIDERIPSIAEDIIFRQNEQIVTEVRNLINEGRELFFTEKFIEAEQVLKRAQSRWRLTHTEDDPEIELWLTRVERALTATSGVVIEEEDPLYADMMQVLNLAREEFQQGRRLFEQGDQNDALSFFRQAEQKIEYIKEPFPNNQAAGVLYLRILQYTQPQDFESIFRERFQAARSKLNSSPEEAYRELQVLQEIRSDFPGLQDAIFQAEIATGIRQPPPDPQKLARARDLYSQAQRIVQQDIRAQFPIALTYLNEAIKLDPDYSDAIVLKDRIQTGQGGQVSVVLSSVDQQKLRQAENLFIDGRYFEARVLVEQLWQNPENRSNPRLVELRRRIESQL